MVSAVGLVHRQCWSEALRICANRLPVWAPAAGWVTIQLAAIVMSRVGDKFSSVVILSRSARSRSSPVFVSVISSFFLCRSSKFQVGHCRSLRVGTDEWEWSPGQLSRQRPVVRLEFGTPVVKVVTTKSRRLFRGLGDDLWQHACERIQYYFLWNHSQLSKEGKENNTFTCMLSQNYTPKPNG